jgi:hypothetical protein
MVAKYGVKAVVLKILTEHLEYVKADQVEICQLAHSGIT